MHHISILIDVYMYKTAEAYGSITTATHLELCDQTALVRTCTCKQHWSAAHDVLTTLIVFYHIGLFGLALAFRVNGFMFEPTCMHVCSCTHLCKHVFH
jgi:phosphotransferase system  glucose/maltose/N-acetylglucosamine-specific IIC component